MEPRRDGELSSARVKNQPLLRGALTRAPQGELASTPPAPAHPSARAKCRQLASNNNNKLIHLGSSRLVASRLVSGRLISSRDSLLLLLPLVADLARLFTLARILAQGDAL